LQILLLLYFRDLVWRQQYCYTAKTNQCKTVRSSVHWPHSLIEASCCNCAERDNTSCSSSRHYARTWRWIWYGGSRSTGGRLGEGMACRVDVITQLYCRLWQIGVPTY